MFQDREDAGRRLAERLKPCKGKPGALVLGVVQGGVVVAAGALRHSLSGAQAAVRGARGERWRALRRRR